MAGNSNSGGTETNAHYDALKADLAKWLITPKGMRNPKSQAAWARERNLSPETVSRWITSGEMNEWQRKATSGIVTFADLHAILNTHKLKAMEGNVASTKLLFEMCGVSGVDAEDRSEEVDFSVLTDEELAELAQD